MNLKKNKIGIGVITCNRPQYVRPLIESLKEHSDCYDHLVCVNDGQKLEDLGILELVNEKNLGSGKTKNRALFYLLDKNCDYIFLIEDDMVIKDFSIFEKYIEASQITGIKHFNYGPGSPFNRKQSLPRDLHTRHLLDPNSDPVPRLIVDYGQCKIDLYEHTVAMFSFFDKEVLLRVGLIDTVNFKSAFDHVEHTYRIIKAGYHPPFWYFADIHESWKYLKEADQAINNSVLAKDENKWMEEIMHAREVYRKLHGHYPNQPPLVKEEEVFESLKNLKKKYGN